MSSTSPEITVLMTVYNGVAFLAEAVESVLNQTFTDFEFLIVDDASTDNSVELIRSYEDSRIRLVLNSENMGQAASLNVGLELAPEQLDLSDAEAASLARRVHRRLGPGVAVVMHLRTLPSAVLFPLLVGLSPMLVSPLRKLATLLNQKLPELRYPGRFVQSRAERLIGQRPQ